MTCHIGRLVLRLRLVLVNDVALIHVVSVPHPLFISLTLLQ